MREILFRGKRVDNSEWIHGLLCKTSDGKFCIGEFFHEKEVFSASVGQFTGLIDKNGKKIFENDILADGAVVKWFDELFWDGGGSTHPGFYCEKWASRGELSQHERFDNDCEIIGNVSDNPELVAKND